MQTQPKPNRGNVTRSSQPMSRMLALILVALALGAGAVGWHFASTASAQEAQKPQLSQTALRQIAALMQEKEGRSPAQQKIDSQLLYKLKQKRGEDIAPGLPRLAVNVPEDAAGKVLVDIRARVTPELLAAIRQLDGQVVYAFEAFNTIRARVPLTRLEAIAEANEVKFIQRAREPYTSRVDAVQTSPQQTVAAPVNRATRVANIREQLTRALPALATAKAKRRLPLTGAINTQGDTAHRADQVRALGINGAGIRVGVLSDGVNALAAQQMAGELPATVTVVPGQAGNGDEGTAMLEIIHDLAPGADLFFARGGGGPANMANNITTLAGAPYNCDIIVDDIFYTNVGVFQDDVIAQAVNTVAAAGVLYFTSAGNAGNLNDTTSGVWEGDFVDGGTLALVPGGRVHDFGGGVTNNRLTGIGGGSTSRLPVSLKWSDPLGGSNNDYDLFILNAGMTAVLAMSTNTQNGSQDPLEEIDNADPPAAPTFNVGDRVVILRRTGAATRALHLNTNRGQLTVGTDGQIFGHKGTPSAVSVAAVFRVGGGNRFTGGAANPVETYSSDGPRRMFYDAAGNALTAGNVLFGSNGGAVRQKPDIAAADCVSTAAPGFANFCGTSAAAPHAAAIAALVWSTNTGLTSAQVRAALTATALDIEGPGFDRDSGFGIAMALNAIGAVSAADLSITKTDSPDPVIAGTNLTYTINVSNSGAGPATFARMNDPLPVGTTFQSLTAPADWTCSTPGVGANGLVNCRKDSLANGETASFTIVVRVGAAVPDGTVLNNTATISATSSDPNNGNNSATATTNVIARADLELLSKVDTPDPVVTNNPLTYTITLRNNGPSNAVNVTLSDPLPVGALFNSCAADSGGVCGGSGQNRTVTYVSLAVGATATVTFNTTANCILANGAVINNVVTISATTSDPNPANNSAAAATVAQNPPPVITCPPDQDVIAATPGSTTAIVTFPNPVVVDNCPGATVVCTPASGSAFPLGTTTVNCTATDSGGATASCSFNVTVWDVCIKDDVSKDYLLFNSFTGDYKFVRCLTDTFVLVGQGIVTRQGCVTTLHDGARVTASYDRCVIAPKNTGGARIKRQQPDTTFVLKDRNILNNSPTCP